MYSMKIILMTLMILVSSAVLAGSKDSVETDLERDVMVSLTGEVYNGNVYFNLLMLNESKPGVYSLVKQCADGTLESIGMKDIGVNTINEPLLYSFVDKSTDTAPVSYRLIRISFEVETIMVWNCGKTDQGICLDASPLCMEVE